MSIEKNFPSMDKKQRVDASCGLYGQTAQGVPRYEMETESIVVYLDTTDLARLMSVHRRWKHTLACSVDHLRIVGRQLQSLQHTLQRLLNTRTLCDICKLPCQGKGIFATNEPQRQPFCCLEPIVAMASIQPVVAIAVETKTLFFATTKVDQVLAGASHVGQSGVHCSFHDARQLYRRTVRSCMSELLCIDFRCVNGAREWMRIWWTEWFRSQTLDPARSFSIYLGKRAENHADASNHTLIHRITLSSFHALTSALPSISNVTALRYCHFHDCLNLLSVHRDGKYADFLPEFTFSESLLSSNPKWQGVYIQRVSESTMTTQMVASASTAIYNILCQPASILEQIHLPNVSFLVILSMSRSHSGSSMRGVAGADSPTRGRIQKGANRPSASGYRVLAIRKIVAV
jgi:hypothetical protein